MKPRRRPLVMACLITSVVAGCGQPDPSAPAQQRQPARACGFDTGPPRRAVMAALLGRDVVLLHADGSRSLAYQFPVLDETPDARPYWSGQLAAAGGFVVVSRTSHHYASPDVVTSHVLLDADGAVRWAKTLLGRSRAVVGADGTLAVDVREPAFGTLVISPDGGERVHDFVLLGSFASDGRLPGWTGSSAPVHGWLDPATGLLEPFTGPFAELETPPGHVVLLVGATLVDERPQGTRTVTLPHAGFAISEVQPDQALLTDGAGYFRADFADGSLRPVPLELPAGLRPLSGDPAPTLSATGAVCLTLRDDRASGLHCSARGAAPWTRQGLAVPAPLELLQRAGDGLLIEARAQPQRPGDTSPRDFPAASVAPRLQLVRLDDGRARSLPDGARLPSLSPDGRCVAYWDGGHLDVLGLDATPPITVLDDGEPALVTAWVP
ncbi:MAG: hypothetical protein IT370_15080 [Deltaproteobacteria bacterium]|nr:hypothetical protein [Deltaproteobacteria bacterium]